MICVYVIKYCLRHKVVFHVTGKQLKMLSHETVHRNRNQLVATEKAFNNPTHLITLHIVGWVIIRMITYIVCILSYYGPVP